MDNQISSLLNKSFSQRLLTIAVVLPFIIWLILYASKVTYLIALSILFFIATIEWSKINKYERKQAFLWYFMLTIFSALFFYNQLPVVVLWVIGMLTWVLISLGLLYYPKGQGIWQLTWVSIPLGAFLMTLTWWIAYCYKSDLSTYLLGICILTWLADAGAYIVGNIAGRHALAKNLSPKKSIEGALGGILIVLISAYLIKPWFFNFISLYKLYLLTLLIALAAIVGDLFISMYKRIFNVKDSGKLFPGHGGILDRLDSLLLTIFISFLFVV